MSKVTSKLQVTLPKALAEQYGIHPGDHIEWIAAGDTIRIIPPGRTVSSLTTKMRLELFDQATERQRRRQRKGQRGKPRRPGPRGWTRDELYDRGRSR